MSARRFPVLCQETSKGPTQTPPPSLFIHAPIHTYSLLASHVLHLSVLFTLFGPSHCTRREAPRGQEVLSVCLSVHWWVPSAENCCSCSVTKLCLTLQPHELSSQASLSFTISWSLLSPMPIELVMLSSHLILCHHFLLLP